METAVEDIPEWEPVEILPKNKKPICICPYADTIKQIKKDIKNIKKELK